MAYKRITKDLYEVQGKYAGYWEAVCTEDTLKEAKQRLMEYDENEPRYEHRLKRVRVRVDGRE